MNGFGSVIYARVRAPKREFRRREREARAKRRFQFCTSLVEGGLMFHQIEGQLPSERRRRRNRTFLHMRVRRERIE